MSILSTLYNLWKTRCELGMNFHFSNIQTFFVLFPVSAYDSDEQFCCQKTPDVARETGLPLETPDVRGNTQATLRVGNIHVPILVHKQDIT